MADIKHFIVLMMENRSFDHMLGFLQSPTYPIDGLLPPRSNLDASGAAIATNQGGSRRDGLSNCQPTRTRCRSGRSFRLVPAFSAVDDESDPACSGIAAQPLLTVSIFIPNSSARARNGASAGWLNEFIPTKRR